MPQPRPGLIFDFVSSACQAWLASKWSYASTYSPLNFVETGSVLLAATGPDPENAKLHLTGLPQVTDLLSGSLLMSTPPSTTESTPSKSQGLALGLMSRGISPWADGGLSSAMKIALSSGCDEFVSAAMKLPEAPSVDRFLSAEVSGGQDVLSVLASSPFGAKVLSAICQDAGPLPPALVSRALKVASPDSVSVLAPFSAAISEFQLKRVHQAWSRRLGNGEFSQEDLAGMLSALTSKATGLEVSPAEMALNSRLSKLACTPWPSSGEPSFSLDAVERLGSSALSKRFEIPSGPMAGTWTGLAAAAAYLVKRTSRRGVYPFQISNLLDMGEGGKGSLQDAVGIPWRPGILLDGVIWLALNGREEKSGMARTLSEFASAAQIDDVASWGVSAVSHARSFTIDLLSRAATPKSGFALATAWKNALSSKENLLAVDGWSDQEKMELAQAVNCNFSSVVNFDGKLRIACVGLFEQLFPEAISVSSRAASLDPGDPDLSMSLSYLLTLVTPSLSKRRASGDVLSDPGDRAIIPLIDQKAALLDKILSSTPGTYPSQVVAVLERWSKACIRDSLDGGSPNQPTMMLAWCKASRLAATATATLQAPKKRSL